MEDRELIGLLYRANWRELGLSGTVQGAEPVVDTIVAFTESWSPPGPWWPGRSWRPGGPGWPGGPGGPGGEPPPAPPEWLFPHGERDGGQTLVLAPGCRFRVESADGSWIFGSDGERLWQWLREKPTRGELQFDGRPRAPFRALLAPSWLLSDYSLVQSGPETVAGRAGVRVHGTARTVLQREPRGRRAQRGTIGLVPSMSARLLRTGRWDEVDAVVDAELGILLRYSGRRGDHEPSVTEFSSLEVAGPADSALFSAPTGSVYGRSRDARGRGPRDGAGSSFGESLDAALSEAVREAAKTVAGLAAGGLGAAIKYGPTRNSDPFAQATAEDPDPEAAMPADEPDPDVPGPDAATGTWGPAGPTGPAEGAGPVSDEVLDLLYRGGLPVPEFTATLHQWFAVDALLDAVPQGARGAGFGGVGFLIDAVREGADDTGIGDLHSASTVRMGGWTRYRIDVTRTVTPPPRRRPRWRGQHPGGVRVIASDGDQRWNVYADAVTRGPARRAPEELTDLVDGSWLLAFALSGGEEVLVDGRRGYRVVARSWETRRPLVEWWERLFFPAVAVVDAETGRLLRLTRFTGGRPVIRLELRDVGPLPPDADFAFTPPAGVPVDDADADDADSDEDAEDSSPDEASWSPADDEEADEGAPRDPAREAVDAFRKQVDETVAAARGFLGSFFGDQRRP